MPEMRRYLVTETREVEVSANNEIDAARIADKAYVDGQDVNGGLITKEGLPDIWGDTNTRIKTTKLVVERIN